MSTFPKPRYHCSQSAFYSVCDTITDNLDANLADFTAFKGVYDAAFVTALRLSVTDARNLPDVQARGATAETFRVQLSPLNDKCLLNWQSLKRYIEAVYPSAEWKPKEEEAGGTYYNKAGHENWENTVSMNVSANNFITTNSVTLQNGALNMPAGFPAQYTADTLAYLTLYNQFKAATETGVPTGAKINANNDVYDQVIEICKDGTVIYDNDAAKAKLFTWSAVLDIVAPPGTGEEVNTIVIVQVRHNGGLTGVLPADVRLINTSLVRKPLDAEGNVQFESVNMPASLDINVGSLDLGTHDFTNQPVVIGTSNTITLAI